MESVDIEGVKVLFPYKPYDIQLDYMKAVIKCLQQKSNGLLESPTGTGKTLSLLCSSMAWIESLEHHLDSEGNHSEDKRPRVLYSSRTHSQLSQTVRQLKQTPYKAHKSVIIASRDQLCLHPEIKSTNGSTIQSQMCRQLIRENKCHFYDDYEEKVDENINSFNESRDQNVLDIEDLVQFGQQFNCCPYYGSRHLSKKSSLVLTPYNYVLDPQIRRNQWFNLKNNVIIFDEGHNIERVCEDCMSIELTAQTLTLCIKHINTIGNKLKKIEDQIYVKPDMYLLQTLDSKKVNQLKVFLINFKQNIFKLIVRQSYPKTQQLFEILEESGLNFDLLSDFLSLIHQIHQISISNSTRNRDKTFSYCSALSGCNDLFLKIFPNHLTPETYESHKTMFCQKYKIFGSVDDFEKTLFTLNIWCLSPSVGAKALVGEGIYNMIITSGTLAPIDSFETEMEIEFAIKLENKHIIKSNQLLVLSISQSRGDVNLISSYMNRTNVEYYRELGLTLIDILSIVPKGVLIFFSSYDLMNKCIHYWNQNNDLWHNMKSFKELFVETNDKKEFNDCIVKYKRKVDEQNSRGAVFFGVCRGKLSEGIDLPDDYCRCVVMTGLPFPSVSDPKVILKKQYLNEAKTKLSADDWYALQMKRSLNQSIGRVVRHKSDSGVIVLLDSRFAGLSEDLSKWIQPFIHRENKRFYNSFQSCLTRVPLNRSRFNQKLAKIRKFFSPFDPNLSFSDFTDLSPKEKKSNNCLDLNFNSF